MTSLRFVSLVPSSTETLLALGADVVACTRFCEQPDLRHVGGTKNPDLDAIVHLAPDVVVMDREENRLEDHDELVARGLRVFASDVRSVDDALAVVDDLRDLLTPSAGPRGPTAGVPPRADGARRRAFVPIWRRPWMSIGAATYGASLLRHLGIDVTVVDDSPYPVVELATIAELAPDLVLVPTEPYAFTDAHIDEICAAVPDARILHVDGRDLFWWGTRTPVAMTRLGGVLRGGERPRQREP